MPIEGATFDLLTLTQVAEALHCSKAHVGNIVAGRVSGCPALPALRLGRRTLIRRASLLAWIEQNERSGGRIQESPERGRKSA